MSLKSRIRSWLGITDAAPAEERKRMQIAEGVTLALPKNLGIDYGRHKLAMPKLPMGVLGTKEQQPQMALDDAQANFNFLNTNTIGALGAFGLFFPGYPYLAEIAQRTEFRQPVETIAKEMTRKWIQFKSKGGGDKAEKIKQLEEGFEQFKIQDIVRKAIEHDGFYGLGHVFIDLRENGDPSLPLVIDAKTIAKDSLRGFVNIEPMWTTPLVWNSTDPTHPNFYKPSSWMVLGKKVDQTRLLRFVSREVPDLVKPAYNFGGISLSQLIEPYVTRWLKTVDSVNRLISNFSIIFLQTDMAAVLEGGPDGDLIKRMKLFIQSRDNQGLFITDKEKENLNQLTVTLSGLSELQAQAQEHMAAPTHLPLVVLTGITPAGLNASSDSEIEIFHDWNHSMQEALLTSPLVKISHVIQLHLWGAIDEDLVFDYVPLKELVGEAASRVRKTASDAAIAYIDAGVISPEEERARLANDRESGYDNLSATPAPATLGEEPGGEEPDGEEGERVDDDEADEVDEGAAAAA